MTRRRLDYKDIAFLIQWGIALILTSLLSACNVNHGNSQNGDEHNDNVTSDQSTVVVRIDTALVDRAYPMTNSSAGPFRLGAVIQDTIIGFEVEKSTEVKTLPEGKTMEIPIYTYYIGNEGWVRVTPQYDAVTGLVSDNTGEIYVYSELFMTDKCIGAVSSLEEFASAYSDITIRYVGECDMFAIETSQLPNVQFLLEREHYTGEEHDLNSSSGSALNVSDFEEKSHFYTIRISQ